MKPRKFIKTKKSQNVDVGSLLIAQPFWQDERYKRSVIYVINHDHAGTTGIIINKLSTLNVKEALPAITKNLPLHYGGPIDSHTISFIHTNPAVPKAVYMKNGLYWGGDFEFLRDMIRNDQIDWEKIKFFAGFVEWGEGQLEAEISENKWWKSELTSHHLFNTSTEAMWSRQLRMNGHIYAIMDEFPDPSLN